MHIKTLAEILAEENIQTPLLGNDRNFEDSSSNVKSESSVKKNKVRTNQTNKNKITKNSGTKQWSLKKTHDISAVKKPKVLDKNIVSQNLNTSNKSKIKEAGALLHEVEITSCNAELKKKSGIDNISDNLIKQLKTPEQCQIEIEEIKSESRLRWLAFYYLSVREHSISELRQKLLNKNQDSQKIENLLQEFSDKGYQSDYRTAFMLIREGIRKGRGRNRIKQDLLKRQIKMYENIDELIDLANEESEEFYDFSNRDNKIDWLRNAVEVRVKKYGNEIPKDQKDKARQLRFLQYRGYESEICFEALTHNLDTLEDEYDF